MEGVLSFVNHFFLVVTETVSTLEGGNHGDTIAPVLLALVIILAVAKLGGEVSIRLGQPAVLGELLGGVMLGNLILINPSWDFFEPLRAAAIQEDWAVVIDSLAQLGVIVLLFEVGLESTVRGMMKVGISSLLVAVLGVIVPFGLGFGVSSFFIKELPAELVIIAPDGFSIYYVHMFIGAVLCATSVGITARVFKDMGRAQSKEARIVLGAAVVDDVLGLIILAVVSGIISASISGRSLEITGLAHLIGMPIVFLGGSLSLGVLLAPRVMNFMTRLRTRGIMLISALLFAFILSYLAHLAGLAVIVGAFAGGLILEERHFHGFREKIKIEHVLGAIADFLVPIFFVLMGIRVRLETFADPSILSIAGGITLVAIIGKQACSLGVLEKGLDRLTVGIGMIPRGEVGLIFASIGKDLKVIDDAIFSAVVIMVILTTLITPPLLRLALTFHEKKRRTSSNEIWILPDEHTV